MTDRVTIRRPSPTRRTTALGDHRRLAVALGVVSVVVAGIMPTVAVAASRPADDGNAETAAGSPTVLYEESVAHSRDRIVFKAGDRVTVPFAPRASDGWTIDGAHPVGLPAGRASGQAIRRSAPGHAGTAAAGASGVAVTGVAVGAADLSSAEPAPAGFGRAAAPVDPGGLKREVFGWLPYWEVSDSSTRYDWETLSTVAYFGVGAAANGDLQRKNADGSTTVGWSGWTSSRMTSVINAAHAHGTRVVLTVQSFAWSSAGVLRQKRLLGSAGNRANLARQVAAAVRDRGADGVNLDFEPIVSTYSDEFTALVRAIRTELDRIHRGYQLTFAAMAGVPNYPLENATAPGGADAVVIMGYDYRTSSSRVVGSVAPVGGPTYDVVDTVRSFLARIAASKVVLAVPYYGRAWSTDTNALHARNISGTKNGASVTVVYGTARDFVARYGRHWDATEGVAWTAYRRQNCTAAYGCVNPWRELYYDDAQALGLKYDVINRYNLRGAGIWALGYDGTRPELYAMLKAKFITDTIPPVISGASISSAVISPNGDGRLDGTTMTVRAAAFLTYGWAVQPMTGNLAGPPVRSGSVASKSVAFTWDGKNNAGAVVRDGVYRITIWVADASNNRASVQRNVVVDRRPAAVTLGTYPTFITPDADGHADSTDLSMSATEALAGSARILTATGVTIRTWSFGSRSTASWRWDGRDAAGRVVRDGRYVFRVDGRDPAGNLTTATMPILVDRTIKSVVWSRSGFTPRAHQSDRATIVLGRQATITVSIYRGTALVRRVWTDRRLAAGTYGWTWDGRTTTGAFATPGTYRIVVDSTSWIGWTRFTRQVTVSAP